MQGRAGTVMHPVGCPARLDPESGRLFDGVSAILGIKERCSYEGQAAILLEASAREDAGFYPPVIEEADGLLRFDWREAAEGLCSPARNTVCPSCVRLSRPERGHRGPR